MSDTDTTITVDAESPAKTGPEPDRKPVEQKGTSLTDADALQAELDKARRETAKYRTERNEHRDRVAALEQQVQQIAKAVGGDGDDPDPEKLALQLTEAQTKYRQERLRNEYLAAAVAEGADIDLTWPYLVGSGAFDDLDVTADDFATKVAAVVKKAVESNPKLKRETPPGSGDQGTRGSGAKQLTEADLERMSPEQIDEAFDKGQLTHLLGAAP